MSATRPGAGEPLLAVDDPLVTVLGGVGLEQVRVRTALRLGHRIRGEHLLVDERLEPRRFRRPRHELGETHVERTFTERHGREEAVGRVGNRHERAPELLRRAAQHGHDLVAQVAGNQPLATRHTRSIQQRERQAHRHAVIRTRRFESVFERNTGAADVHRIRELVQWTGRQRSSRCRVERPIECLVQLTPGVAPPARKRSRAGDRLGNSLRVETYERLVVGHEVAAAQLRFSCSIDARNPALRCRKPASSVAWP